MPSSNIPLGLKLQVSRNGLKAVLWQPKYLVLAASVATLVLGVLLWLFNIELLLTIWQSTSISLIDKLLFMPKGYASIFTNFDSPQALTMFLIAVLTGINATLAIYIYNVAKKLSDSGKGVGAVVAGIIGSGCAVCGTGILGPIFATFGGTISSGLSGVIGLAANFLAITLLAYSIFGLGIQAANRAQRT